MREPAIVPPPTAPPAPQGVLGEALAALERHRATVTFADRIGIADYTAHSREFRFHLADVEAGAITKSFLVSHGRGSDPANRGFAERFSNVPGSNASSRGSYVTGAEYVGKHGRSRRLHGLEDDNNNAFDRAIVIHGADYVDSAMAENQGRVGRSLGCFAFEQGEIATILELLGEGRLLYAAG
ncbi:murein L,D-transpeptidase catalytic domain family protein [Aurantiacibacter gilvus]|uniref:Murein L,D-transpeptidase catalytic domain family protein n=1 Tax=Aurantiacibacter gilvus TaxID=3139141 RepID=A0ABU9IA42_9SPHN